MNQDYLSLSHATDSEFYSTSDICLAATISLFLPVYQYDKTNPQRVLFVFKRGAKLEDILTKYLKGEIEVEVRRFFNQFKFLKNEIYNDNY